MFHPPVLADSCSVRTLFSCHIYKIQWKFISFPLVTNTLFGTKTRLNTHVLENLLSLGNTKIKITTTESTKLRYSLIYMKNPIVHGLCWQNIRQSLAFPSSLNYQQKQDKSWGSGDECGDSNALTLSKRSENTSIFQGLGKNFSWLRVWLISTTAYTLQI